MIDYVDEEKERYVTKGVTTLALFLIKLTFAILEKQGKMVDTAWLDAYCESYASMQKENFVHEMKLQIVHTKSIEHLVLCQTVYITSQIKHMMIMY